jgi:hypothetical protein
MTTPVLVSALSAQDVIDGHKRCSKCDRWLELGAFRPNARVSSGFNSWCRACCAVRTKQWREASGYNERYNASRRILHEPRRCLGCGEMFTPVRRDSRRCAACR